MKEDINTLQKSAHLMMLKSGYPGYRGCSVVGNTLHFSFDTPENAENYSDVRELSDSKEPMSINGSILIVDFSMAIT
jgi:hypothetical protein